MTKLWRVPFSFSLFRNLRASNAIEIGLDRRNNSINYQTALGLNLALDSRAIFTGQKLIFFKSGVASINSARCNGANLIDKVFIFPRSTNIPAKRSAFFFPDGGPYTHTYTRQTSCHEYFLVLFFFFLKLFIQRRRNTANGTYTFVRALTQYYERNGARGEAANKNFIFH